MDNEYTQAAAINSTAAEKFICARHGEASAYLDGELHQTAAEAFERHAAECQLCRSYLNEQRRVLAVLESALATREEFRLPDEFARKVTARARTDMSGVRSGKERRRALRLVLMLASATLLLLSLAADERFGFAWRALASVAGFAGQASRDFGAGVLVLTRAAGNSVPAAPGVAPLALCGLLILALLILLRLLSAYRCEYRRSEHGS